MTTATADAEKNEDIVVVNIGKKKRKHVRRLRKGRGRLMSKVQGLVEDMKEDGVEGGTLVVVAREKRKKNSFKW